MAGQNERAENTWLPLVAGVGGGLIACKLAGSWALWPLIALLWIGGGIRAWRSRDERRAEREAAAAARAAAGPRVTIRDPATGDQASVVNPAWGDVAVGDAVPWVDGDWEVVEVGSS